jgi:hypothetical protein
MRHLYRGPPADARGGAGGDRRVGGDGPRAHRRRERRREREADARGGVLAPCARELGHGVPHLRGVPEQARRHLARPEVAPDPARPRVVRHERELDVAERAQEPREVTDAGAHVRDRVERIRRAEARPAGLLAHRRP